MNLLLLLAMLVTTLTSALTIHSTKEVVSLMERFGAGGTITAATGITSLGGLTGATQTFSSNQLVSIISSGSDHLLQGSTTPTFSGLRSTSTFLSGGLATLQSGFISVASSTAVAALNVNGLTTLNNGLISVASTTAVTTFNVNGVSNLYGGLISPASSTLSSHLTIKGNLYASSTVNFIGATVQEKQYPALSYATSTAWTGTTTIYLGPAYVAETWNGVKCTTDVGTLRLGFNDGTNYMNPFQASTTVGTVLLSENNTFTSNTKRFVDIGNPVSSPTKIGCTVDKTTNL